MRTTMRQDEKAPPSKDLKSIPGSTEAELCLEQWQNPILFFTIDP